MYTTSLARYLYQIKRRKLRTNQLINIMHNGITWAISGCGDRLKNLCAAMVSLVYTVIVSILASVRMATFGLFYIKLIISRG